MNIADLIIFLIISLFIFNGYHRGFIRQFADFLGLILSVFVSFAFYGKLTDFLSARYSYFPIFINKALALLTLWLGSQVIFYIAFWLMYRLIPTEVRQSKLNKFLGALPGAAWGILFTFIFSGVILVLLGFFPSLKNYQRMLAESFSGKIITVASSQVDSYFAKIFGRSLNDTLTFKTVSIFGGETLDLGFRTSDVSVDRLAEEKMLEFVNKERIKRGLKPLVMDEKLRELARAHSRDMFARGYFAHNNPDGEDPFERMDRFGIKYLIAGENLALAPTVEMAHEGLMNSPGHRANILTPEFRKVGIGCINGGKYGLMFSQEFTN